VKARRQPNRAAAAQVVAKRTMASKEEPGRSTRAKNLPVTELSLAGYAQGFLDAQLMGHLIDGQRAPKLSA